MTFLHLRTVLLAAFRIVERLVAVLAMLAVLLFTANLWLSLDRRQAQFEAKVSQTIGTLGRNVTLQIHTGLDPLSQQATGLLADVRGKVNALDIAALNSAVSNAGGTATALTDALHPLTQTAGQINAALPDFLDCQQNAEGVGNKGCLYYRYSDLSRSADVTLQAIANAAPAISRSAETTADAVAKAAPSVANSVAGVASSANGLGRTADKALAELTRPKTLRQKIESWLKFSVYAASRFM